MDEICPDISTYWQVGRSRQSQQWLLCAKTGTVRYGISEPEAVALQYCTGKLTLAQLQHLIQSKFPTLADDFIDQLLDKLVAWGILVEHITPELDIRPPNALNLKPHVQWIEHPDGYWILRNAQDITYLQVDAGTKQALDHYGQTPPERFGITTDQLQYVLKLMAAKGMLVGTSPVKPPPQKFTPMRLLFFRIPLWNPDPYLGRPAQWLDWIWTRPFFLLLLFFLTFSTVLGFNLRDPILYTGALLWENQGATLLLPFGLLAMLVVTLHELGHALTLKHYGGIVPEIGLLLMFFMPAAYTNTSDSYALVKRHQRIFVVAAGVLCQFIIGAIALWLWHFAADNSWLKPTSYLLLVASLFTIAINLNPMAKLDGYYLAVALTGINNLRDRSFGYYRDRLTGKPSAELPKDRWILALYAPLSLIYLTLVFGSLLLFASHWILDNIAVTAFMLLLGWVIYYFFPESKTTPSNS